MAEDLRVLCALARARYPHAVIAVAGESMGGAVAIEAFASDRPPDADRLVLLSPAVWGGRDQPLAYRAALWSVAHTTPRWVLTPPSWVTRKVMATDNLPELHRMGRDPMMIFGSRADTLYGLVDLMGRAQRDLARVRAPVFYLYGRHDQLIPKASAQAAVRGLKPTDRSAWYPDGWHLLLRDRQAQTVWSDVAAYLRDPAAPLPSGAPPLPASTRGSARGT